VLHGSETLVAASAVPWDFEPYARWINVGGSLFGALLVFVYWLILRYREGDLAGKSEEHERPSAERLALELLLLAYVTWVVAWLCSSFQGEPIESAIGPLADQLNSASILAAALVLWLPRPSRAWRLGPTWMMVTSIALAFSVLALLQFTIGPDSRSLIFSLMADAALAVTLALRSGNLQIRVAAAAVISGYAALQFPANSIVELSQTSQRVCLLGIAALKPLLALLTCLALSQRLVLRRGQIIWEIFRAFDQQSTAWVLEWAFVVHLFAPIDSLEVVPLSHRIFLFAIVLLTGFAMLIRHRF